MSAPFDDLPLVILAGTRPRHRQVTVRGISVDAAIAPLLTEVWDHGLGTQYSCQGNRIEHAVLPVSCYEAYILFTHRAEAYAFQQATADLLADDVQAMMRISVHLATDNRASVTFPPALLDLITERWINA